MAGGETENRVNQSVIPAGELGGRLAGMSLPKQVLTLAMWPFIEQVLGFFTSMTDFLIAGRMESGARAEPLLEALAVGAYVGWLIFIVQGATSAGATALVSRATGARDANLANKATAQAMLMSIAFGTVLALVLYFSADALAAYAFGLKGEAYVAAGNYLRIFAWSAPFSGIVFSLNAALRGAGDTASPFRVMVVVNVLNVALSLMFVYAAPPFGGYAEVGLAFGTVIAWAVGAVMVITILIRRKGAEHELGELKLRLSALRVDFETIWRVLRIGLPSSGEIFIMWVIHVSIARYISALPVDGALGSHMMAVRLESMSFLPGFAIGTAAATLVGQYLGAENPERAREAVIYCWKVAALFMCSIGVTLLLFARFWVGLIAPDAEQLIEQAVPLVIVAGIVQPVMATCIILKTAMRGAGDTKRVMFYSFFSQLIWRVIVLWSLVVFFEIGLLGLWICLSVDLACQAIIFTVLFFKGHWMKVKV